MASVLITYNTESGVGHSSGSFLCFLRFVPELHIYGSINW